MLCAGKVAIVTGGGGAGSGRAISRRLAREGAAVVAADIDLAGAEQTVREIEAAGGRSAALQVDLADESQVARLIEFACHTFGGLDLLVNNASAPYDPQGLTTGWFDALRVDLLAPMHATLAALEVMRARGGGAIVNIGSTSAIGHGRKHSKSPGYDVAKMGVMRLTTTLAPLAERDGVRVNCLVPDWVATPELQGYVDSLSLDERRAQGVPDTLISLDELATAVVRLATDQQLAGRIMLWWNGQPPRLIPAGDLGYAALE